jgi:uncharacterized membrane protein YcjF (UPF0283 family)
MKQKDKREKKWNPLWKIVGIGVCVFFIMMLVSNVIQIGLMLREINVYCEYGFYGLTIALFYALILRPIHNILFLPSFSEIKDLDEENKKNLKTYKMIMKNNHVFKEEKTKFENCESIAELKKKLNEIFKNTIKEDIDGIIHKHAKLVFISTSVSQNEKIDMYAVIILNLKMIKEIIEKCGFRPSYLKLCKLSINVFVSACVAWGEEKFDLAGQGLQRICGEAIKVIPFIGKLGSSLVDGTTNALLTLRIGYITRNYLFHEGKFDQSRIRKTAIDEASKSKKMYKDAESELQKKLKDKDNIEE